MPQTYNVGARSRFVTATAWVFIVLAALTSAAAIVQNAAVASRLPSLGLPLDHAALPLLTGLLLGYLPWVVGAGLVVSCATLAAAIGLGRPPHSTTVPRPRKTFRSATCS